MSINIESDLDKYIAARLWYTATVVIHKDAVDEQYLGSEEDVDHLAQLVNYNL